MGKVQRNNPREEGLKLIEFLDSTPQGFGYIGLSPSEIAISQMKELKELRESLQQNLVPSTTVSQALESIVEEMTRRLQSTKDASKVEDCSQLMWLCSLLMWYLSRGGKRFMLFRGWPRYNTVREKLNGHDQKG